MPAAAVGGEEEHELDPGLRGRLDRRPRLRQAEVVELAHGRVPGRAQLAVDGRVLPADRVGRLPRRLEQHRLAPRPEVAALGASAQRALERVRVRVDEAGEGEALGHAADSRPTRPGDGEIPGNRLECARLRRA